MKKKELPKNIAVRKRIRTIFFCCALLPVCIFTLIASSVAWFARPKIDTSFNASVVKSYFDADSVINIGADGKLTDCVFIITKPVHLYNLAYLTDKGIFNERTTFQLGKPRLGDSTLGSASDSSAGGEYFVYKNNTDNEKSDFNLTEKVIDMTAYTKYGGIPPIGVSGANTEFCHTFRGNGITIANCSVTDNVLLDGKRAYFPHVGLFGTVTDGANVSNFNVLNLTINSTKENPGASLGGSGAESSSSPDLGDGKVNMGLFIGYINQSPSTLETDKVSFTSLGVANGVLSAESTAYSAYTLVGNGTEKGLKTAKGFFDVELASGNTGIVNFTEMINTVRTNVDKGQNDPDGSATIEVDGASTTYSYKILKNYREGNIFDPYVLKNNTLGTEGYGEPVGGKSGTDGGINFKGRQVIKGNKENGLGVFTLVTRDEDNEGDKWGDGLGDYRIRGFTGDGKKSYDTFYYITAEYRDPEGNDFIDNTSAIQKQWEPTNSVTPGEYSPNSLQNEFYLYKATFQGESFNPATSRYFSKDYFSAATASENAGAYTYFRDYLHDTLIYSGGAIVEPASEDFGITAKYEILSGEDKGTVKNVEKTQFFLQMTNYQGNGSSYATVPDSEGNTYAANSIHFTLHEDANVTLYYSSKDSYGQRSYLGLYDVKTVKKNSENPEYNANPLKSPNYAVLAPSSAIEYTYYDEKGNKGTVKGELIFAHTFNLKEGSYFFAASDRAVSICAIEVQGQEDGNAGNIGSKGFSMDFIGENQTDVFVGGEGYAWSRTAFILDKGAVGSLVISFQRIYAVTEPLTDIVYAYVKEGDAAYVKPYGEMGVVEPYVG